MTSKNADDPIIFEEREAGNGYRVAFVRLNAEKALNALSQSMIDTLLPQLDDWAVRDEIACVVLYGSGEKAFCAGGDIIGLYRAMDARDGVPSAEAEHFFVSEYRLDHAIHRFPKPVLCWGHGAVMGGGLGLMAGASHRVVTQASKIAMPEVGIGLVPDVGASWFLGRMPRRIGLFLGLSTTPVTPDDALWLGLADYRLSASRRDSLFDALTTLNWAPERHANDAALARLLHEFETRDAENKPIAEAPIFRRQDTIARLVDVADVAGFQAGLEKQAETDDWFAHGVKAMSAASPTSLAVVYRQLARDSRLSIEQALRQEFAMAVQCTRGSDFPEGIRALLIDKDKKPRWSPSSLDTVEQARVDAYFQLPSDYDHHPLGNL